MRVGWYVHHHGAGHRTRALAVGAVLAAAGHEVTLLGSRLGELPAPFAAVHLPGDDEGVDPRRADATASGRLHWVPLRHDGLRERGAAVARWVGEQRPDVLVGDVSVEMSLLGRLLGVPVVVVAQPGARDDEPHRMVHDIASRVLAPWPEGWARALAPSLGSAATDVVEVGGISRLEPAGAAPHAGTGVVLTGSVGLDDPSLVDRLTAATPQVAWRVLDGRDWVDDVGAILEEVEVVVAHAGQNAVADVAALGRPALLLPQERPFGEQEHLAAALAERGLARVVGRVAQADPRTDWAAEVEAARRGGGRWDEWGTRGAAERAARVVEEVAGG